MADQPKVSRRDSLRGLWLLMLTSFRVAPVLATLTFTVMPLGFLVGTVMALWLRMVTNGVFLHDTRMALTGAALLAATVAWHWASGGLEVRINITLNERVNQAIDEKLAELTALLPGLEHHERPEYLDKLQLLRSQAGELGRGLDSVVMLGFSFARMALAVGLLMQLDPWLILLVLSGVPGLFVTPAVQRITKRAEEANAEPYRLVVHLHGLTTQPAIAKELRVGNLEAEIRRRHADAYDVVFRGNMRARIKSGLLRTITWATSAAAVGGAVALVAWRAARGLATPGDVMLASALAAQTTSNLSQVISFYDWTLQSLRTAGRFMWLVDYAEAQKSATPSAPVPTAIHKGITFENVSFTYPGTEKVVLEDISVTLPAGGVVAVVGENGAGKTTLIKLITRFYEPSGGRILVDDIPLADLDHELWRSAMSAGFQDFQKLELLARETVGVGALESIDSAEEVTAAISRAGGADVVERLPSGLDTMLGKQWDEGVELSIGQWQKLALARALMREPLLLVLDEPTSALDAETEHALFERFADAARRASNGGITLLVSHRFSTVRMADLILVIDGGRIVEQGTHAELMAIGGQYAELYELQARAYR